MYISHILGLEYGYEVYFILEITTNNTQSKKEADRILGMAARQFPKISMTEDGSLDFTSELREHAKRINVKFHGDLIPFPFTIPTTYEETVKFSHELPNLVVGDNTQCVPVKFYACPLDKIGKTKSVRIVKEINKHLVDKVVMVIESLESSLEDAKDMIQSTVAEQVNGYRQNVLNFENSLNQYKNMFQHQIGSLVADIRGRRKEESELVKKLEDHSTSPFSKEKLRNWLQEKKDETIVLRRLITVLDEVELSTSFLKSDPTVSLIIYYPNSPDIYLDNMSRFLDGRKVSESISRTQKWFRKSSILNQIQTEVSSFLQYKEVNMKESVSFIYAILTPKDTNGHQFPFAKINAHFVKGRQLVVEPFIPPGKPLSLQGNNINSSVHSTWSPPSHGADFIVNYTVVVTERGHRIGQNPIQKKYHSQSNETNFVITTSPENSVPYDVSVYGVSRVGRTASSESLQHSGVEVRLVGGAELCSPSLKKAQKGRIEVIVMTYHFFRMDGRV